MTVDAITSEEIAQEEENAFLSELTALSRRTGIVITGCGCCGSPFLVRSTEDERDAAYCEGVAREIDWKVPGEAANEQEDK